MILIGWGFWKIYWHTDRTVNIFITGWHLLGTFLLIYTLYFLFRKKKRNLAWLVLHHLCEKRIVTWALVCCLTTMCIFKLLTRKNLSFTFREPLILVRKLLRALMPRAFHPDFLLSFLFLWPYKYVCNGTCTHSILKWNHKEVPTFYSKVYCI